MALGLSSEAEIDEARSLPPCYRWQTPHRLVSCALNYIKAWGIDPEQRLPFYN